MNEKTNVVFQDAQTAVAEASREADNRERITERAEALEIQIAELDQAMRDARRELREVAVKRITPEYAQLVETWLEALYELSKANEHLEKFRNAALVQGAELPEIALDDLESPDKYSSLYQTKRHQAQDLGLIK